METKGNLPNLCLHPDPAGRPLRRFIDTNCICSGGFPRDFDLFFLGLPLETFTGVVDGSSDSNSGGCREEDIKETTTYLKEKPWISETPNYYWKLVKGNVDGVSLDPSKTLYRKFTTINKNPKLKIN